MNSEIYERHTGVGLQYLFFPITVKIRFGEHDGICCITRYLTLEISTILVQLQKHYILLHLNHVTMLITRSTKKFQCARRNYAVSSISFNTPHVPIAERNIKYEPSMFPFFCIVKYHHIVLAPGSSLHTMVLKKLVCLYLFRCLFHFPAKLMHYLQKFFRTGKESQQVEERC